MLLTIRAVGQRSCRNTMSNKDEGCSVSSDNGRETYVKICIIHIYIFAKSFHSSWSQYNSISNINCAAQIQTEHNQQYFKSRPSLRKCGCPMNLKLDRGVALEQLSVKAKLRQAERRQCNTPVSCMTLILHEKPASPTLYKTKKYCFTAIYHCNEMSPSTVPHTFSFNMLFLFLFCCFYWCCFGKIKHILFKNLKSS